MKKIKLIVLMLVTTIGIISCNNDLEKDTKLEKTVVVSERFSDIGRAHNEMLNDFYYGDNSSRNASKSYRDLSIEEYFGVIDKKYVVKDIGVQNARTADEGTQTASDILLEELSVSEISCSYISQVEEILETSFESMEETKKAITEIEAEALVKNSEDDIFEFLSYAETAKASLEFWNENLEILEENREKGEASRGIIKNLWNKYKHKLGMMAASDAAGAAAGAAVGAIYGSQIPAVGTALGATIGATVAGAASSAEGFKKDCVCIIIPLTDIQKKIENQ